MFAEHEKRREDVIQWQHYYNMIPRNDSKLTILFCEEKIDWSAQEVARELIATDFIFSNTLYGEVIADFMRQVAGYIKKRYTKLTWTQVWDITRFYAPVALKLICLSTSGLAIPPCLPPCKLRCGVR